MTIYITWESAIKAKYQSSDKKEASSCSHPEDPLSGLVSEAWSEQQAVQLLHAPLQQHSLHLLTWRAAPQEFIQHIQGPHRLIERGKEIGEGRWIKYQEIWIREAKVLSGHKRSLEVRGCQNTRIKKEVWMIRESLFGAWK